MGHRRTNHRPLRAGIGVTPNLGIPGYGTLTGIARRNSDGVLVAVTNLHVVSDGVDGNGNPRTYYVDEQDSLHQWDAAQSDSRIGNLYADTEDGPVTSFIPVGSGDGASLGDVAAVELATGVSATFDVHVHVPGANNHRQVPIVAGTIDPVYVPNPEEWEREFLTLFGATTGEHAVEVTSHHDPENIDIAVFSLRAADDRLYSFQNVFRLKRCEPPSEAGDSGAPLLKMDEYGNFRMSAIYFASKPPPGEASHKWGYCFPASVAERELGITFGTQMPTADAGDSFDVVAGGAIELNGSDSRSNETGGDPLSYTWVLDNATGGVNLTTYNPLLTQLPPHSAEMSIPAPDKPAFLTFKLIVADRFGANHIDRVYVTVVNTPPVAKPGINRVVPVHTPPSLTPAVTLVGAAEDPDAGHVEDMRYSWRVDSAPGSSARSATTSPTVALSDANVAEPTFTPTAIGDYVFTLTVRDPGDLTHSASVTIHACRCQRRPPIGSTPAKPDVTTTPCRSGRPSGSAMDVITEFQWIDDPDNEVWGNWGYTGYARNLVMGDWVDTDPLETTGSGENRRKKQSQTTTFESGQERTSECGNTETRWERKSTVQTRWIDYPETGATPPPPSTWVDTGQTRNRVEGPWSDTGRTQQDPVDDSWEKEQTRTVTWEKEQIDSTGNVTEPQWVSRL